ncbi:hypothetical protein STEG23_005966 [Scotinomys teguina]
MQPVPTRPRPPLTTPASLRTRHPGASCCGLRLAACHAMEHPPADTQGAAAAELRTQALQTSCCPDSPLLSQVLTLACTHPEAESAETKDNNKNHMGLLLGRSDEITSFKNTTKGAAISKDYKSNSVLTTDGLNHIYSRTGSKHSKDPHTVAGPRLPSSPPRRTGSAGAGKSGPQRAAHAMRDPQLPASASRLPPPRHGQQQQQPQPQQPQ